MKDFIDDFHSYNFTGTLHNDERSDHSDIEIKLSNPVLFLLYSNKS